MEIVPYEPGMATDLTRLWNEAVHPLPHTYPLRRPSLAAALAVAGADTGQPDRRHESVWVAQVGKELVGFVHVAVEQSRRDADARPQESGDEKTGLIRCLWHRPGQRTAGAALLEQAERALVGLGMSRIVAFSTRHRYPFYYLPPAYLSDQWGHVAALLGLSGYEKTKGEVFLNWRNFTVSAPGPDAFDVRYTVEYPQGAGRLPNVKVRALVGEEQVGVCLNECLGNFTPARPAQEWLFTGWLGVEDDYQGRGLGRSLLQRALAAAREVGYRHACISTDWHNYRAFAFYSNFGYQVRDWTYCYARTLA